MLCGFTYPNFGNQDKLLQEAGYQLEKLTRAFPCTLFT